MNDKLKQEALAVIEMPSWFAEINATSTLDEAILLLKKVDLLKHALDAVKQFHDKCIEYAKLEAHALIRVVELSPDKSTPPLKGKHKETAVWLYGMNNAEREKYIAMCADGLTIDQVYYREVKQKENLQRAVEQAYEMRRDLLEELNKAGFVDMREHRTEIRHTLPDYSLASDINDGTRKLLLLNEAVCAGDGYYVKPQCANGDEAKKAFFIKFANIVCAANKLVSFVNLTGVVITVDSILEAHKEAVELIHPWQSSEFNKHHRDRDFEDFYDSSFHAGTRTVTTEELSTMKENFSYCTRWIIYALTRIGVIHTDERKLEERLIEEAHDSIIPTELFTLTNEMRE